MKNFKKKIFFENTCGCVLGPWIRAFLSLASRGSVLEKAVLGLGIGFFLCAWPWPRALCPRIHLWFASSISSKIKQPSDIFEDIEKELLLFRSAVISLPPENFGRKWFRVAGDSEKITFWWNQKVKEAIRAKKDEFKALLQDKY